MLRILDRIYLGAASAGSGGGSVDESKIIVKSATIPTAGEDYLGSVYMYVGETNSTYTHGYIYECVESGSTYAWERIDVQPGATRGRFLALWNCATGLAESNPPSSPYPYGAGDYYIVGTVGTTNYKPSGSSYVIGTASTTVETDDVAVNDTYYYDGTSWNLQKNTATTVDQTYDPTSANAQSGTAVAQALATVSVDIDNTTITENASNELQASAVMNARTGTDVMPIWQGTEQEWTNGKGTDWYNWRTDVVFTSSNKTLPVTGAWTGVAYGNGIYVAVNSGTSSDTNVYAYSYDGETWVQGQMPSSKGWRGVAFNNGIFVAYTWDRYNSVTNIIATSTDGLNWTERTVYSSRWNNIIVVNNKFFLLSSTQNTEYLTSDDGINWVLHTKPGNNSSFTNIAYGNGVYVFVGNTSSCCTSTDLQTWESHNIGFSGAWYNNVFGSGNFVITDGWWNLDTSRCLVSTDGISWTSITLPLTGAWHKLYYLDNLFILLGYSNNKFLYSSDGINWSSANLPTASNWGGACFGNKYIFTANANNIASNVVKQQGSVYTLESAPTTASTVYSEPNTTSALTITSVGTGTITLSDNNTYTYTSSGDVTTYQTIGDAYPNYLANINGVGVKIGNTLIADNTDTSTLQTKSNLVTSVSSLSTDSQYPSAKLLYDTVGNIEATLDAIIAQGSNS